MTGTRLRYLLRPREVGDRTNLQVLSVYRDHGVVPKVSRSDNFNKTPEDITRYQEVRVGDLVVNKMKAWQGSVGISTHHGIVSPDYLVCSVNLVTHSRFFHYLLRSAPLAAEFGARSKGIRPAQWRLYWEDLAEIYVALPPLEEQRRIADFLDAETVQIDQLAQSRDKQLEVVAEHDAAETYDMIRGATLGAPMHVSGSDWLGLIADGFRTAAVSHEFEVALGKMLNPGRTQGEHLRPYLRNTNVQWDRIDTSDLLLMDFPPEERIRYQLRPGDLLVCEGGEPGRAAVWDGSAGEIYYQKALHRIRPRGTSSVRWLYYCLRAATYMNVFAVQGNTTTIAHLTGEQLKAQRFPFPDRAIQDKLVSMLDERAHGRRAFQAAIDRQLALLAERRQALITAAVTGQIDVTTARGVSA